MKLCDNGESELFHFAGNIFLAQEHNPPTTPQAFGLLDKTYLYVC